MVKLIIFKLSKLEHLMFKFFFKLLNFQHTLTFRIEQFRIFDHFLNQSIIAI